MAPLAGLRGTPAHIARDADAFTHFLHPDVPGNPQITPSRSLIAHSGVRHRVSRKPVLPTVDDADDVQIAFFRGK